MTFTEPISARLWPQIVAGEGGQMTSFTPIESSRPWYQSLANVQRLATHLVLDRNYTARQLLDVIHNPAGYSLEWEEMLSREIRQEGLSHPRQGTTGPEWRPAIEAASGQRITISRL